MKYLYQIYFCLAFSCQIFLASAQVYSSDLSVGADSRGPFDLTICSQNLHNFGLLTELKVRGVKETATSLAERADQLATRFIKASCDVLVAQEIVAKTEGAAAEGLSMLADAISSKNGKHYVVKVGPISEGNLSLGFLVAKDRADVVNLTSYDKVELPRLSSKQRPRLFARGPLEIQLIARSVESNISKTVTIVNMHLKSKHGSDGDVAGLEWETYRMEMAEALRRIVEKRHARSFASGQSILIIAGDRNSDFDSASARILEGTVTLKSFQEEGGCRLSKRGVPLCKAETTFPQRLFSALTPSRIGSGIGSFHFKNEWSWLDDLVMPGESLPFAWRTPTSEGDYESGVILEPVGASDHGLVYMRLNW